MVLDTTTFRGKTLTEWLESLSIDVRQYMLTKTEWDAHGIQQLVTDITEKAWLANANLLHARENWRAVHKANKALFAQQVEAIMSRSGGRAQITTAKNTVEVQLATQYQEEATKESIKEFWEGVVSQLLHMQESAKQLAFMQSVRSKAGT